VGGDEVESTVKWIEDRAENFVATTHERGQIHDAEIALDKDGHILGCMMSFCMTRAPMLLMD